MKKVKKIYIFLVIMILLLIISPTRNLLKTGINFIGLPIENRLSNSSGFFKKISNAFSSISSLKAENEDLANKLRACQIDRSKIVELENENSLLKKQLNYFDQNPGKEMITAKVVAKDPINYFDEITINKGENDGINQGAAVISEGALIGKIEEVSDHQSKVILISSKNSIIQAMLEQSRATGILKGGLSGITLSNIPSEVQFKKGDVVTTSGLGGKIEPGIIIGQVTGERSAESEIFKTLNVEPYANFSNLEVVIVLK